MAYAQLSPATTVSTGALGSLDDLRRLALRLAGHLAQPLREAHRRLLLRQQLEALSDRLLADAGIARDDLPAALRRR